MPVGLLPSTILMIAVWLYMGVSGLLIAEANLYVREETKGEAAGLLATIAYLLGRGGAIASAVLYLFIHYALLVAYTARGGDILAMAGSTVISTTPLWVGHVLFIALLGTLLFFGKETFIGRFNSLLLLGVIVSFFSLVALTAGGIESSTVSTKAAQSMDVDVPWEAIATVIPIMFVAFVYHNVVPVVVARLDGDRAKIRQAIFIGSLIPLILFLVWNAVILLSVGEIAGDPIEQLQSGMNGSRLGVAVSVFSELAVATSFIGFVYGLLSFFEDALPKQLVPEGYERPTKFGLVFLPPLVLSVLSPTIFFDAIEVAGAFGVSILFGVLPAVMVWQVRYSSEKKIEQLVPGKKVMLVGMVSVAIAILCEHTLQIFTRLDYH